MAQDLEFRIVVRDDGSASVERFEGNVKSSMRDAARAGERGSTRLRRAFQRVRRTTQRVRAGFASLVAGLTSLKGIIAAIAGAVVIGRLIRSFRSVINAASQQEDAVVKLNNALRTAGIFSEQLSEQAQNLASSLQAQTRFGDEAIIAMQSLLITYGVTADKLEEATKASLDFATATGKDLTTAALTVGKAAAGFTGELSRYGIIVKTEGIPPSEVFTAVLAKMNRQFGGRAQADVRTFSGRMAQLGNALGDVEEIIGRTFTGSVKLNEALGEFVAGILAAVDAVKDLEAADIGDLIAAFVPAAETAATIVIRLVAGINALVFAFKSVQLGIVGFLRTTLRIITTLSELADKVGVDVIPGLKGLNKETGNLARTIGTGLDVEARILIDDMTALEKRIGGLLNVEEKALEATRKAVAALRERNRETKAQIEFQKALAVLNKAETDAEINRAAQRADAARRVFEALRNERQEREAAAAANLEQINNEQAINAARVAQFLEGIQTIRQVLIENETFLDNLGQRRIDRIAEDVTANVQGQEAIAAAFKKRVEDEIALEKARRAAIIPSVAATFGALAQLTAQGGEKLFALNKAFAVGEAVTQGILAVQRTLAAFPFPFNIAPAAAVAALAAANVAQIIASRPGGGGGGINVPGGGGIGGAPAAMEAPIEAPIAEPDAMRGIEVNISVAGFIGDEATLASALAPVISEAVGNGVEFGVRVSR